MFKFFPIAGIIAASLLCAHTSAQGQGAVVAKVNGKPITETDMRLAEGDLASLLKNLPPHQQRRAIADFLIENQLLADATKGAKLDTGPSFESQLQYATRKVLRDQFFQAKVMSAVTEAEARRLFDEQIKTLKPEDEVRARHILVESETQAIGLRARISQGADFATMAAEFSKDPGTSHNGGDLGYFMKGQMDEAFEAAAFTLAKGAMSQPFRTSFGWHLVLVEDRRAKPMPTFEQLRDVIIGRLIQVKTREVITDLRSKASVDIIDPALTTAAVTPTAAPAAGPPAMEAIEPPLAATTPAPRAKPAPPPKGAAKAAPAKEGEWQKSLWKN